MLAVCVAAPLTGPRFSRCPLFGPVRAMRLHMLVEVVGAHKALIADRTRKPLLSGVRSQVPLELI